MKDDRTPTGDPPETDAETAQQTDPKSGRSDDPRVDPMPENAPQPGEARPA